MSEEQDLKSVDESDAAGASESTEAPVEETSVTVEDAPDGTSDDPTSEDAQAVEQSEPDRQGVSGAGPVASPVLFPEVTGRTATTNLPLDRIYDLQVPVSVELGRSNLTVQDILQLGPGSVVELDQNADAPVTLYVHGKSVAMGEIVVVDEYYGVRITSVG